MELLEAIWTRRSVRRYASMRLDKAAIQKLLEAAAQAPSASNAQPWAFGIIEGSERLRELSDRAKALLLSLVDGNPAIAGYRRTLSNPGFNIFYGAPALVAIYAKPAAWPYPKVDCALAAQNLMLAAHDIGLGTCWIGFAQWLFDSPELKNELGIPLEYQAVGQLAVGYPEGSPPTPTPRKAPEVAFWIQQGTSP